MSKYTLFSIFQQNLVPFSAILIAIIAYRFYSRLRLFGYADGREGVLSQFNEVNPQMSSNQLHQRLIRQ